MSIERNLCIVLRHFCIGPRDPALLDSVAMGLGDRAKDDAAFMIFDPADDAEGFLLTGDDIGPLLEEAYQHITGRTS